MDSTNLTAQPAATADPSAAALEAFLDAHRLGRGPVRTRRIGDGHSNLTYLVERDGGAWVLRRPPHGPLPPSAHDVLREFRILVACAGTAVRIPEPLAACADPAVLGAPFYVMAHVPGEVLTTRLGAGHDPATDPQRIADELVMGLAEIHALDWRATGLEALAPPPETYLERQLRRFQRLWEHNRTRELPVLERVTAWLERHCPASSNGTLVHGDYRLGNTIFSATSPARLEAVLDWELATVGDPLADVGYLSATYAEAGADSDPLVRLVPVTAGPGFPSRQELVARYAELTGRDVDGLAWYETLALWKSAVFLEGSYARLLKGTAHDPFFASLERGVPELAERAWAIANGA